MLLNNMVLGTTTWRKRNRNRLERTEEVAKYLGLHNPIIIDYGPGGAVDFLIDWLPEGGEEDWSTWDKLQRGVVKLAESALRKTNLFSLETSEPEEIAYLLEDLSPQRIYVVDKERKVIDAVRRMVERNGLPVLIGYHTLDIQNYKFEQQGDIVVAYNVIERTGNPAKSLDHIARTTRIGGLFSTTMKTAPDGFQEKGEGLYQRVH